MSGIAGILQFDGRPVEPGTVERLTCGMASLGPHGRQHWREGAVALGHAMLRATPEAIGEIQPLANEDASLVLGIKANLVEKILAPRLPTARPLAGAPATALGGVGRCARMPEGDKASRIHPDRAHRSGWLARHGSCIRKQMV